MWLTALVVLPMGLVPQFSSPESSEKKEKGWGEKFKIYLEVDVKLKIRVESCAISTTEMMSYH